MHWTHKAVHTWLDRRAHLLLYAMLTDVSRLVIACSGLRQAMTLWQEGQLPGAGAQVTSAFHMYIVSDCTLPGQVVYKLQMTLVMSLAEKQ